MVTSFNGEKYTEALEKTNYSYQTLLNSKWVASKIELCKRLHNLSWTHHREVASLNSAQQKYWLDRAEEEQLSKRELRQAINQVKWVASHIEI